MKGTAILFQEQTVTFIEDVDHSEFKEMQKKCDGNNFSCKVNQTIGDFGSMSPVFWHEDEVDWDYGY